MPARLPMRAVAFAYHNVGVRCVSALLAHGVELPLVVTHRDAAGENIWFDSVAKLCERARIECLVVDQPDHEALAARLQSLAPQYLFSFYYRHMLPPLLLGVPARGAFNMHGSLLPKYRGRAPVNWAVLHGESETGATLHEMAVKPDAGDILDQQAVPILSNDTAYDVFHKVTVAAEMIMCRVLPALAAGRAPRQPQDLARGSYFSGRRPEDGRIDWSKSAWSIHNLVRAVAPPYPGAFAYVGPRRLRILRTWWPGTHPRAGRDPDAPSGALPASPALMVEENAVRIRCADGGVLRLLEGEIDGEPITAATFARQFGTAPVTPT